MPLSCAKCCVQLNPPHIMWVDTAFYRRDDEVNQAVGGPENSRR
jgi:hypothetical protein